VIIGNGSDELLTLLVRAFAGPERRVGETKPSYSLYPVLASIQNTTVESIDLPSDYSLPVDEIHRCSAPVFFLTTPNAPFGVGYSIDEMKEAINGFKGVFVADEAYVDFGDSSAVTLLGECPNLIVTRTFSKSYGLAGLRVGYAVGSAESIDLLDRFRDSYNVNRLSQAGALAALKDTVYHADVVDKVRATRERFSTSLRDLGWEVIPSQANFVFARPQPVEGKHQTELAADAFTWLESHKVLVRYFPNSPMTSTGLRITIGTDEEMSRCLDELKAWQAAL
jgi:histidinol-phosphate aminotransferase